MCYLSKLSTIRAYIDQHITKSQNTATQDKCTLMYRNQGKTQNLVSYFYTKETIHIKTNICHHWRREKLHTHHYPGIIYKYPPDVTLRLKPV